MKEIIANQAAMDRIRDLLLADERLHNALREMRRQLDDDLHLCVICGEAIWRANDNGPATHVRYDHPEDHPVLERL